MYVMYISLKNSIKWYRLMINNNTALYIFKYYYKNSRSQKYKIQNTGLTHTPLTIAL